MAPGTYKGETPCKGVTRVLVWQQHLHLLKPSVFTASSHAFLASRVAGDVATLQGMGVPNPQIWAIEKERKQYEELLDRRKREGFRLFTEKIETVMGTASRLTPEVRSVYLDYCGTVFGTAKTTRRVVGFLPAGSALSVTLFLGREHERPEDREAVLLHQIQEHTRHRVSLAQSIFYWSFPDGGRLGPPMGTWTFFIGPRLSRSKMRFNLHDYTADEIQQLAAPEAALRLWRSHLARATIRSRAAVRANITRSSV
jgi:hypothetical protein